jgi:hypothetical protein
VIRSTSNQIAGLRDKYDLEDTLHQAKRCEFLNSGEKLGCAQADIGFQRELVEFKGEHVAFTDCLFEPSPLAGIGEAQSHRLPSLRTIRWSI